MSLRFDPRLFKSRVARRVFSLFVLCGVLPLVVLGGVTWFSMRAELHRTGGDRVAAEARDLGMAILERLNLLAEDLRDRTAAPLRSETATTPRDLTSVEAQMLIESANTDRLSALAFLPDTGHDEIQLGQQNHRLSPPQKRALRLSRPVLVLVEGDFYLISHAWNADGVIGVASAKVDSDFLWWGSRRTDVAKAQHWWQEGGRVIASSSPVGVVDTVGLKGLQPFTADSPKGEHLVGPWALPARAAGLWIFVSRPYAEVFAPLQSFTPWFLLLIVSAALASMLGSSSLIHRGLQPVEQLAAGTRRIAKRDFDTPVVVPAGDEFGDLAASFNDMAGNLASQFETMTAVEQLGQVALSLNEPDALIESAMSGLCKISGGRWASIALLGDQNDRRGLQWIGGLDRETSVGLCTMPGAEVERCIADEAGALEGVPSWVESGGLPAGPAYALPILSSGAVRGVVTVGGEPSWTLGAENGRRLRQVVGQVGVAFANLRLVGELESLSRGTLRAMARAVDAKSAWTMGHSERVADLGLRIGATLGLPEAELDILYRGGLLHDIGKIGIPLSILDKPGKLTGKERAHMEMHPELGARILEPIESFSEVIPIVLEHHEWYVGGGYPSGRPSAELSLHGRIFAVADVFDALCSPRPYRPGVDLDRVLSILAEERGRQFDPFIIDVFMRLEPWLRREASRYDEILVDKAG